MSLFVDASAIVAMMTDEPEAYALEARVGESDDSLCSALALWEAARAVASKRTISIEDARRQVDGFTTNFSFRLVAIAEREFREAIAAHARYGKGTGHPAQLNMGDCFAYACAKTNDARLLYKGDDFSHTDLA